MLGILTRLKNIETPRGAGCSGILNIAGEEFHTLEPVDKRIEGLNAFEISQKKICAIQTGIYKVTISWSPRFKKYLPVVIGTIGFSGIRIHPLNWPDESEGCIGLGTQVNSQGAILYSHTAVNRFMAIIKKHGTVDLQIRRADNFDFKVTYND